MPARKATKAWWLASGLLLGLAVAMAGRSSLNYTSTDAFCSNVCHAHPHATQQWERSAHFANTRGVVVHCVDCHLPPGGATLLAEKVRLGSRDAYGQIFLDVAKIDWTRERTLDRAVRFTYDAACTHCHSNLFGQGLSKVQGTVPQAPQQSNSGQREEMRLVARRMEAHLYYQRNRNRLRCINCHLFEGHRQPATIVQVTGAETSEFPLAPSGFQNYTQHVPQFSIKFRMIAVPGGTLDMGSPELGLCRQRDTGPVHSTNLKPFWMAQVPVGSHELEIFYAQKSHKPGATSMRGREVGAQTWQAAGRYAEWLSQVTGMKFRLPTEAELEYACMAGGVMPGWRPRPSRADVIPSNLVLLNAWGLAELPNPLTEFTLDYPLPAQALSPLSGSIGGTFRVVREWEPTTQVNNSRAQLGRPTDYRESAKP